MSHSMDQHLALLLVTIRLTQLTRTNALAYVALVMVNELQLNALAYFLQQKRIIKVL